MEAILFIIIIGWAVKKAAESGHLNWQGSKRANRRRTQGQPAGRRSAAALQHDTAYWAHEVTHGFPSARHGLVTGWHTGQQARYEGTAARARARTDRLALRARVTAAVREQRRRQAEILEEIRATHGPDDLDPLVAGVPGPGKPAAPPDDPAAPRPTYSWGPAGSRMHWPAADREEAERWAQHMSTDGHPKEVAEYPPGGGPGRVTATYSGGQLVTSPAPGPSPTTTEGNSTMPASDTTYTQQMSEYASLRRDAEEELNSATRKRMTSRLDILMSLGLDPASLAEAAAIDDALREQEKAARQALDATDAAIQGLSQRHGGIKAAVDDAPVDKPADAEFYADLQDRPETMGIFSSDDDKAFAAAIKVLLGKMPAHVRSEIMRDLDGETAATVRQALAASAAELRSGTRTCDSCRQGLHGSCAGQGCACG